jgi:hypothetical protein
MRWHLVRFHLALQFSDLILELASRRVKCIPNRHMSIFVQSRCRRVAPFTSMCLPPGSAKWTRTQ